MNLSNNIRAARTRMGLSQQRLADLAGVTRQTISGLEGGLYAPSAAVAIRLARALGSQVEELFWFEDDFPIVEALPACPLPTDGPVRVSVAQIDGAWVAHPLAGDLAFRSEMVPADGIAVGRSGIAGGKTGATARVQLLDDPEVLGRTVIVAGCTPALSLWTRSAERWRPELRVHWTHANSTEALQSLARGEVHAAGIHLCDPATGEQNLPFVRELFPCREVALVNLGVWEEGLIVQEGNPRGLRGVSGLAGGCIRIINREVGAGSRLLLDTLLRDDGIDPAGIAGYGDEVHSHQDVARGVLAGKADAGVSTASVATIYGLDFIPLRRVRYDLAFLEETLQTGPVRQLLSTLHHRWVRSQLRILGGYDTTETGEVTAVARTA